MIINDNQNKLTEESAKNSLALVAALLLGQEFQDSGSSQMGQWLVGIVGGERVKGSQGLGIVLWGGY